MGDNKLKPLKFLLDENGIALDQKLEHAILKSKVIPTEAFNGALHGYKEDAILYELIKNNSSLLSYLEIGELKDFTLYDRIMELPFDFNSPIDKTPPSKELWKLLDDSSSLSAKKMVTTGSFLQLIGKYSINAEIKYFISDFIAKTIDVPGTSGIDHHPKLRRVLELLSNAKADPEEFQFTLSLVNDKLVFRIVDPLKDYYQKNDKDIFVPQRALLCHLNDIGLFTNSQIEELEFLINDPRTKENDIQLFFSKYPHFLSKWDYRQVHPQVFLTQNEESTLIPDFILTNPEIQKATILDLKCPNPKLVVHKKNRVRFSMAVMEAKTQLRTYQRFFEDKYNRERIREKLGMEVYHPHLSVIIGRLSDFNTPLERQQLIADNSDIEVVTYDEILNFAKRRKMIISP